MKALIGLAITTMVFSAMAQEPTKDLTYRGKAITQQKLDQLYDKCGGYIFTDGEHCYNVFTMFKLTPTSTPETRKNYVVNDGDSAYMYFEILQVISPNSVLAHPMVFKWDENGYGPGKNIYHITGDIKKQAVDGDHVDCAVVKTGVFPYNNTLGAKTTVPELKILQPASKEQFRDYLKTGVVLCELKTITIPAPKCPQCKGTGKIPDRNKMDGVTCPSCRGTKTTGQSKTDYEKSEIR